jgi:hypothetical protein
MRIAIRRAGRPRQRAVVGRRRCAETAGPVVVAGPQGDTPLLSPLRDVFCRALRLQTQIRCTSLPGSKLPIGSRTDDALRDELASTPAFVALITPRSVKSDYVLLEMCVRWGAKRHFAPLLAAGGSVDSLPEPLLHRPEIVRSPYSSWRTSAPGRCAREQRGFGSQNSRLRVTLPSLKLLITLCTRSPRSCVA